MATMHFTPAGQQLSIKVALLWLVLLIIIIIIIIIIIVIFVGENAVLSLRVSYIKEWLLIEHAGLCLHL